MAITFWYDHSSTYSYLAAMRIEEVSGAAGVEVEWQPFLLGPIFAEAGYGGSPNLTLPSKADYMWRDIGRRAEHRGIGFAKPEVFPQKSVSAARAALSLSDTQRRAFSKAVFRQVFVTGADMAQEEVIREAAAQADLDPDAVLAGAAKPSVKEALFKAVERAKAHGIFGAPAFVTSDGTLFWGDDRLEDALSWETTGALPPGR